MTTDQQSDHPGPDMGAVMRWVFFNVEASLAEQIHEMVVHATAARDAEMADLRAQVTAKDAVLAEVTAHLSYYTNRIPWSHLTEDERNNWKGLTK